MLNSVFRTDFTSLSKEEKKGKKTQKTKQEKLLKYKYFTLAYFGNTA